MILIKNYRIKINYLIFPKMTTNSIVSKLKYHAKAMNLKIKNQEMNYYKIGYYKMLKKNVTILILIIKEMIILNYWDNKMYLLFNYQSFKIYNL